MKLVSGPAHLRPLPASSHPTRSSPLSHGAPLQSLWIPGLPTWAAPFFWTVGASGVVEGR